MGKRRPAKRLTLRTKLELGNRKNGKWQSARELVMARLTGGETIIVRPTNNIYTVLAAVGLVVVIIAFAALWFAADRVYGPENGASKVLFGG
jgi:hypothetical protein